MSRETWYVMEDGSAGDPRDIRPGKDGKLVHKDGRKVAYAPHGPRSRGVDVGQAKKPAPTAPVPAAASKPAAEATTPAEAATASEKRDVKPEEPKRTYKTRESKGG